MTLEVTEATLARLGVYMVGRMEDANRWAACGSAENVRYEEGVQLGMTEALTILGIPVRQAQREPSGQYTYVEIGGQSFNVTTYETD